MVHKHAPEKHAKRQRERGARKRLAADRKPVVEDLLSTLSEFRRKALKVEAKDLAAWSSAWTVKLALQRLPGQNSVDLEALSVEVTTELTS